MDARQNMNGKEYVEVKWTGWLWPDMTWQQPYKHSSGAVCWKNTLFSLFVFLSLSRHQWPAFGGGWPGRCNRDGTDLYWTEECRPQTGSVCQRQHQVRNHISTCVIFLSLAAILSAWPAEEICTKWVSNGQRLLQHPLCPWYNCDEVKGFLLLKGSFFCHSCFFGVRLETCT